MVLVNYATKEIVAKIVYYGPGLCGKTTNLQQIFSRLNTRKRGKMISLATEGDRTLFFDFLPLELGVVQGFKVRFQIYTVPGQVFYSATRKLVLKGADAVIFVADSQADVLGKNIESFEDMKQNLVENHLDPSTIPIVLQYNKRDLPNVSDIATLNAKLNSRRVPWFAAVATEGTGVVETFKEVTRLLIKDLKKKHSMMETGVVEELPSEVFEERAAPARVEEAGPAEMVIERIHGPKEEEEAVKAGSMPKEMETISLTDTAQAEAFLDDVRKGAPAGEAKLKAEMMGARIGEGPFERELTPDELDFSGISDEEEEEMSGPADLPELDELPDMDFTSDMEKDTEDETDFSSVMEAEREREREAEREKEKEAERERERAAEIERVRAAEIERERAAERERERAAERERERAAERERERAAERERERAAEREREKEAEREREREKEREREREFASVMEAETGAEKDEFPGTVFASETGAEDFPATVTARETAAEAAPLRAEPEPRPAEMPGPAAGPVRADFAEVLDALLRLEGEVISLKFEVAKLSAEKGESPGTARFLATRLETLSKELNGWAEGQDRLLLGIIETLRDSRRANAEAMERIESALKQLTERSGYETKAPKKKWF